VSVHRSRWSRCWRVCLDWLANGFYRCSNYLGGVAGRGKGPSSGRCNLSTRTITPTLHCRKGGGRFQASMLTVRTQSCLIQRKGLPPSRSPVLPSCYMRHDPKLPSIWVLGRSGGSSGSDDPKTTPIVPSRLMVLSSEILILFNTATPRPTSFAAAAAVGIAAR
jgi:hypothetical protein